VISCDERIDGAADVSQTERAAVARVTAGVVRPAQGHRYEPLPFLGALFETLVASEIIKTQFNTASLRALYYFRDQQGLEVDFIVPRGDRRLFLIEAKASRTVTPQMGDSLARLGKVTSDYGIDSVVDHRAPETTGGGKALRPGITSSPLEGLLRQLAQR
jgi:predicted AAA+ superfamily ATPase